VLTGILELIGLEPFNKNVASRAIYVHGTNKEKGLGGKHSNGCIRVSNDDILYLLSSVTVGTKLYVKP
jgi:lipoprotein-anchoring transpeptidase ErfK/SrfK